MKLSVGDKVRVYFYPPKTTESFVEGIVERTEVKTFDGPGFALQMLREVVMGRESETKRTLPYIVRYETEDDFEGRIVILETAAEPDLEPEQVTESETVTEAVPVLVPETGAEAEPALEAEAMPEAEPELDGPIEAEPQPESQKQGWTRLFGRVA
jgi:hypothetical protein